MKYSFLFQDGKLDYLLSCEDTWEAEEKLKEKFSEQISAYWTNKSITSNELIKVKLTS